MCIFTSVSFVLVFPPLVFPCLLISSTPVLFIPECVLICSFVCYCFLPMWLFYSLCGIIKSTFLKSTSYSCALLNSPISAVI